MGSLKVQIAFMGLCLFAHYAGTPGPTVVIPDFSSSTSVMTPRGATCVESHLAYIAAQTQDIASCDTCEVHGNEEIMRLGGDQITIEGLTGDGYSEQPSYNELIPTMKDACPGFRLVQPLPATASTLKIDKGTLSAAKGQGDERYSILSADLEQPLIKIHATHGNVTRTMTLRPTASVTAISIVNRYANSLRDAKIKPLAMNHWLAYYSLAASPVVCDLPTEGPTQETTIACSNGNYRP